MINLNLLNSLISQDLASKICERLRKIDGVYSAEVSWGNLSVVSFPIGWRIRGNYDPNLLQQAITSEGCNILKTEVKKNNLEIPYKFHKEIAEKQNLK